jgi:chromatin structure-remodeling complex subunit RSC3/30
MRYLLTLLRELLQQSRRAWLGLPPFLHRPQDSASYDLDFKQTVFLQLHLDYLYDQFLLYRILSKRQNTWSPDLVKVSHEILSEVLLLIESRVRSMRLTPELSWVVRSSHSISTHRV